VAGAAHGDQHHHHGHTGKRSEGVAAIDRRPRQVHGNLPSGNVAGLHVGGRRPLRHGRHQRPGQPAHQRQEGFQGVDGGIGAGLGRQHVHLPGPPQGVRHPGGGGDRGSRPSVGGVGVVGAPQADRKGEGEGVDGSAQSAVVLPHGADHRRQVGAVERAPRRLGGPLELVQSNVDGEEAPLGAAAPQQRRTGDQRRAQQRTGGAGPGAQGAHGAPGVQGSSQQAAPGPPQTAHPCSQGGGRLKRQRLHVGPQDVAGDDVVGYGPPGQGPGAGRRLQVEQVGHGLYASQPVEQGVVELHHHRRLAARQTLHQVGLPQRPGTVKGGHQQRSRPVQQLPMVPRLGHPDPPQVVCEVEVGVNHPPGGGQPHRREHGPLAQAEGAPAGPLEGRHQALPVGRLVEGEHDQERRARPGVVLAGDHQSVESRNGLVERRCAHGHSCPLHTTDSKSCRYLPIACYS
jgi:hypothetical protein